MALDRGILGPMKVVLHFVAREGQAAELVQRLGERGFDQVRLLPGGRVVVAAEDGEVAERLGLVLGRAERDVATGPRRRRTRFPAAASGGELPPGLAELVERWYLPPPPDRLSTTR